MKLRRCSVEKCGVYNLSEKCRRCGSKTEEAGYKFKDIKDENRSFKNFKK
jgi:rRNA maturation protein Nop10